MRFVRALALAGAAAAALCVGAALARPIFVIQKPTAAVTNPTTISWTAPAHNTDGTPLGTGAVTGYVVGIAVAGVALSWAGDYNAIMPMLSTATSQPVAKLGLGPGMYWLQVAATTSSGGITSWSPAVPVIITTRGALAGVASDRTFAYVHNLYVGQLAAAASDQDTASGTYLQGFLEGAAFDSTQGSSANITP